MRVALVHDWITGMRGGERVLDQLASLFPEADLYTLFYVPGTTTPRIDRLPVHPSLLSRLPGVQRYYRLLLPLFPLAIERFHLRDYDLVVSCSHAVAKGIRAPGARHVCYCFTPMRYVWDQVDAYLGQGLRRALAGPLLSYLRRWDVRTSREDRVTEFIGISETVANRIRARYRREARVIYPPVDVDRIQPDGRPPDPFFLLVGGFVPYKREEIVVEAFRGLDQTLLVAGDGPRRRKIEARAPSNVRFLGRVTDRELAALYARCRALLYPQEEDFGIVAVEGQAAGRPVIALGRGGATESVLPLDSDEDGGPTGLFFEDQTPRGVREAVLRFLDAEARFDPIQIRKNAERFSTDRFRLEITAALALHDPDTLR
jgi:glycosyltransferase involved in cell wall biosynthesis